VSSALNRTSIPFSRPYFPGGEAEAVAEAIESRWVAQGPKVEAFEQAFAQRVGAPHGVATSNGTTALHLALLAVGIGPGDEVVVPSLSFIATANAVRHCGGEPAFADVDERTFNLDPAAAEAAITPRTKALMPVHQIGLAADMDEFAAVAERHGLALVEDAAPALGASYKGRQVGSLAAIACFSLHARKVITTGEGGMITTSDAGIAAHATKLRQHAMSLSALDRHRAGGVAVETYDEVGFNSRMSDVHAALGLAQLGALEDAVAMRRARAAHYSQALAGFEHLEPPFEPDDRVHSFQSYQVRVRPSSPLSRNDLMQKLDEDGVTTRRGVMAAHLELPYRDTAPQLPATEALAAQTLLLPLFPELEQSQQDYVLERLAAHLGERP
jgi:dTDP-4-amino-4,6-dideoxygalactose transaminase